MNFFRIVFSYLMIFVIGCLGAAVLTMGSFFITTGNDHTQEATVGVITRHGLPFPFAFTAPGFAWTRFDSSAAIRDFIIYFIIAAILIIFIELRQK